MRRAAAIFLLCCTAWLRAAEDPRSESTRQMAELLARLARDANPTNNPFLNAARAEMFARRLDAAGSNSDTSAAVLVNLHGQYALELLQAGRSLEAVTEFQKTLALHRSPRGALFMGNRDETLLRTSLALSWLRLGEQENCISNHTALSCLLPIDKSAAHKFQRGSRSAIPVLLDLLIYRPNNLSARWLLNLAYMTLGEYPEKVPPQYLVPPSAFASDYDIGRFTDVAGPLGLDVPDLSGGSIAEDFDNDGDLDIVCSSLGLADQLRYFRNNGDGTFTERSREAGLLGIVGGLNIMQTDFNNDGAPDIFVLRGGWFGRAGKFPKSLLRNRGDGSFDDVTESAGLLSFHPTQTAAWLDYDGDGWLDVFIGHESREGDTNYCELYRNNHNGTFTECAAENGLAIAGWVKGTASGDFNNDGRPDLYISRLGEPNILLRNDGPAVDGSNTTGNPRAAPRWLFTDVTAQAGVAEPRYSFPTWFFDYDNDGWEDIFVGGYHGENVGDIAADYLGLPHHAERPRLYHNHHDGTFADVTRQAGLHKMLLAMGANFGDLDNDGWLDFYLGTGEPDLAALMPNRMFRNEAGARFEDVTTSGGFGHLQKGHGISFADLDHDGDQDVYQVMGGAVSGDTYRNVLYENPGHGNNWVKIKLAGSQANRAGLGARLKLTVATPSGPRVIHRTVTTGGSFGASPFRQEIGLGRGTGLSSLEILWPGSNTRQSFTNLPIKTVLTIREGDATYQSTAQKAFPFRKSTHAHHHP